VRRRSGGRETTRLAGSRGRRHTVRIAATTSPTGRTPWGARGARPADVACASGLVLCVGSSLVLAPLVPALLATHPVLLEALTGSLAAIVTGGAFASVGRASLALAVLAAIPGLMLFDPFFWWAGRRWGGPALRLVAGRGPRAARAVERAERWTRRWGWRAVLGAYFLPVPSVLIFAAAGWSRMRLATFLLLDLLGALPWIGLLIGAGYAGGTSAVDVAEAISHYALAAGLAILVAVLCAQALRLRRVTALGGGA
jgi:membrane-associated protein